MFELKTTYKNGIPLKTVEKASATVIPKGSMIALSSGLAVVALDNSAAVAWTPIGAGNGETEVLVLADPLAEFWGEADADFAVTNRWTEVDMVTRAASLTTGVAEDDFAVWELITDGSFRINIDGTDYNVDWVDFDGDGDMDDVAATLQAAIRAETSSTETVTFNATDDVFVITSASTGVDSYVWPITTSTGTVGTDISTTALLNGWVDAATLTTRKQLVDLWSSTTDVFKVSPWTDAGKVDSPEDVRFRINLFIE